LLAIRSHVDICDPRLLAVEALLEVRDRMKEFIDIQLVAFRRTACCVVAELMRS
jgi:cytosine deaminase